MNHEAINQRIQALESELAGLKLELNKPNKFEFNYVPKNTFFIGSGWININDSANSVLENFRYRQTEANAKADLQLQKELMCIGALAEQIDPDYKSKVDWKNDQPKYYIVFNYDIEKYIINSNKEWRNLGVVYIPKEIAIKICEILNNKEIEL